MFCDLGHTTAAIVGKRYNPIPSHLAFLEGGIGKRENAWIVLLSSVVGLMFRYITRMGWTVCRTSKVRTVGIVNGLQYSTG